MSILDIRKKIILKDIERLVKKIDKGLSYYIDMIDMTESYNYEKEILIEFKELISNKDNEFNKIINESQTKNFEDRMYGLIFMNVIRLRLLEILRIKNVVIKYCYNFNPLKNSLKNDCLIQKYREIIKLYETKTIFFLEAIG